MPDTTLLERARADVGVFAEALVGQPLWKHQAQLARSTARIKCVCSGRQAGKSRALAVMSLHEAYRAPERRVLIVSAGEDAAKTLLDECSLLCAAPLLAGSVVDDTASLITLSNGSTVRSVPASERQIRGRVIDLLVIDEACFVADDVWRAARYVVIARPGSRVVLASTPWGRRDRFFAVSYRAGQRGEPGYASFHWPSTASPLVDRDLLAMWRATSSDREYQAEVEAEWTDPQGAYFTPDEIDQAIVEYPLVPPEAAGGREVVGGCDWGFARDASTLVLLAAVGAEDPGADRLGSASVWWVPYLREEFGMPYSRFIDEVVAAGAPGAYKFRRLVSEQNGVGQMPSQVLSSKLGFRVVEGVSTTAALKEETFGAIKMLLQQGRLVLPRHPGLLRQLEALEFEQRDSGSTAIAVPERSGHDDIVMGLALAAHADRDNLATGRRRGGARFRLPDGTMPDLSAEPRTRGPLAVQPGYDDFVFGTGWR